MQKPAIFLAFANDRCDDRRYLRNLPEENRRLRDVLNAGRQGSHWDVIIEGNSTTDLIFKTFQDPLNRGRIVVFHFGGHADGTALQRRGSCGDCYRDTN